MTPSKISVFLKRNQSHPKFMEAWLVFDNWRMIRRSINLSKGETIRLDTKNDPLTRLENAEDIAMLESRERLHAIKLQELIGEIKSDLN